MRVFLACLFKLFDRRDFENMEHKKKQTIPDIEPEHVLTGARGKTCLDLIPGAVIYGLLSGYLYPCYCQSENELRYFRRDHAIDVYLHDVQCI